MKYKSWHFYMKSREGRKNNEIIKKLRDACDNMTGRKPGSKNEPLQMEKLTKTEVQITWPMPCTLASRGAGLPPRQRLCPLRPLARNAFWSRAPRCAAKHIVGAVPAEPYHRE